MPRPRDLMLLYEKLAQLARAGVPLKEALGLVAESTSEPALRATLHRVRARVEGGAPLTEACGKEPSFSPLEIALLGVGEMNGRLDLRLDDLAALFAGRERQRQKLRAALAYPSFLLVLSFLLPPLSTWYTQGLLAYLRAVLSSAAPLLVALGLAFSLLRFAGARRPLVLDRALLLLPGVGRLAERRALGRFCRALSALIAGGVELRAALDLARRTLGNRYLVEASAGVHRPLERGGTLAQALAAGRVFPDELVQRVAVAERAGEIDRTLLSAAEWYELEADERQRALLGSLPLVLFVLIGIRVAVVVIRGYTERLQGIEQMMNIPELQLPEIPQ